MEKGIVFDIQRMSVNNGPGIRTTAFLKGCPLRCRWCHNPEAYLKRPQIMYMEKICHFCGHCVKACKTGALEIVDGKLNYREELCKKCGKCTQACPYDALKMKGREMTSEELVQIFLSDKTFYETSGGGITLSGGEPTAQFDFMCEVLDMCKAEGLHTTVDTSGYCSLDHFNLLLEKTDCILFDVKHMDSKEHVRCTGVPNEMIKDNLKKLSRSGVAFKIRYPMIPGYNDSLNNMFEMAEFLKSLDIIDIDISVFHEYYVGKYEQLFKKDDMPHICSYAPEEVEEKIAFLESFGIHVHRI